MTLFLITDKTTQFPPVPCDSKEKIPIMLVSLHTDGENVRVK